MRVEFYGCQGITFHFASANFCAERGGGMEFQLKENKGVLWYYETYCHFHVSQSVVFFPQVINNNNSTLFI